MAEESSSSPSPQAPPPPPPLQYVEVNCNSSGKTRRFATGTDAGFAVAVINRKGAVPVASHIEAMKDGEEPIAFGPNSILSNFGEGWKLHTVTFSDLVSSEEERKEHVRRMVMQTPGIVSGVPGSEGFKPISLVYIVKIMFAFILLFVLGAIFTLFLDNLPALILFVKSIV